MGKNRCKHICSSKINTLVIIFKILGCYCENLPINCSSLTLGGYDLIADTANVDDKHGLSLCTYLPDIPPLSKKVFYVESETLKSFDKKAFIENTVKQLLTIKPNQSKCIIMLSNRDGYNLTRSFAKKIKAE